MLLLLGKERSRGEHHGSEEVRTEEGALAPQRKNQMKCWGLETRETCSTYLLVHKI